MADDQIDLDNMGAPPGDDPSGSMPGSPAAPKKIRKPPPAPTPTPEPKKDESAESSGSATREAYDKMMEGTEAFVQKLYGGASSPKPSSGSGGKSDEEKQKSEAFQKDFKKKSEAVGEKAGGEAAKAAGTAYGGPVVGAVAEQGGKIAGKKAGAKFADQHGDKAEAIMNAMSPPKSSEENPRADLDKGAGHLTEEENKSKEAQQAPTMGSESNSAGATNAPKPGG